MKRASILIRRTAWTATCAPPDERPVSGHACANAGGRAHECWNFRRGADGRHRGYFQVEGDAGDTPGRLRLERLGAPKAARRLEAATVVFCATHPRFGGLRAVGFHRDATLFREARIRTDAEGVERIERVTSRDAVLIPEPERVFPLPVGARPGRADLCYGCAQAKRPEILTDLTDDMTERTSDLAAPCAAPPPFAGTAAEFRRRSRHLGWEGRARTRSLPDAEGWRCDVCGHAVAETDRAIRGGGLELRHLRPWSKQAEGETRTPRAEDFAALCAIRRRAIRRWTDPTDVAGLAEAWRARA